MCQKQEHCGKTSTAPSKSINVCLSSYTHIILCSLLFMVLYAAIRITGSIIYMNMIDLREVPLLLFNGLRTDISALGYIMALPVLLTFIRNIFSQKIAPYILSVERIYLMLTGTLIFFTEICTFPFMEEYASRPNRLFLEYLIYPAELSKLMIKGHMTAVISITTVMIIFCCFWHKALNRIGLKPRSFWLTSLSVFIFAGLITFIAARSSFDHRPFNIAKAIFSNNQIMNSLTANSGYVLATSVKALFAEKNNTYKSMTKDDIISTIRNDTHFDYSPATQEQPTLNRLIPTNLRDKKNIVIILEESMGAGYVETLHGTKLTPNLDKIYREGWGFANMYATGVRSVRGIEAVTAGFTPTINTSTVKREKSQKNFFNLAAVLEKEGYNNTFIYGGESHFDNMKSFFLGNGYSDVIDFEDFSEAKYVSSWGASDEDLFNKALEHFDNMYRQNQTFYSLVFTSSNHDPFDIDESFAGKERNRETAVRYADYALGKFYDTVKTKPYFKDTVFLVIADHDSRTWGNELVPIKHFHIPAVLFGSDITARTEEHVVSQIDIPKTLLSLAGISAEVPTVGYDLSNLPSDFKGRALLQFYNNFCYLRDDGKTATVLPNEKISTWQYDFSSAELSQIDSDPALEKTALAYALFGELAYQNGYFSGFNERK
ncbi:MAG: LTA synthase family protein [Succinivibrionaceae bacterium]|nr:LTA synthase family protein [Succinivibrionaceae bacterium]